MRVTILSVGSRGDFQPLLAFGVGLAAAGHEVRMAAFPGFEDAVQAAGLEFAPLAEGRVSRGGKTAADRRVAERGGRQTPALIALVRDARSVAGQRLADALAACEGADAIVTNELALLLGWQAAEHFGAKLIRVRLCPPPRMAHRPVARGVRQIAWLVMRRMLAAARRESGLPALPRREPLGQLHSQHTLELYAFSPAVVPVPAHSGPWTHVTGYWFLDGSVDPEPPQALVEFLGAGPAPVCIGFGSMIDADPAGMTEMAVQALRGAGQRGVLIRGEHGFGEAKLPDDVFAVERVSHDWLFERCAAVVHHGGAGTAAAVLRAGLPSVVVPHMIDQKAWGRALHELGVAPAPVPRRKLSGQRLQQAIVEAVTDPRMRERAASVGERIREEDGIASAIETFERHLGFVSERSTLEVTNG
jgi:UDP:flavonoid glycosyltransferase YjiC (YdhE family)